MLKQSKITIKDNTTKIKLVKKACKMLQIGLFLLQIFFEVHVKCCKSGGYFNTQSCKLLQISEGSYNPTPKGLRGLISDYRAFFKNISNFLISQISLDIP